MNFKNDWIEKNILKTSSNKNYEDYPNQMKKELEKQKRTIMEKANNVLEQDERKNLELCNAIQEIEQIKIIEELQPLQTEYRKISEKAIDIQKKIDYTVIDIEKKWKYEIFGTITEQKLKESYTELTEKQKN